MAKINDIEQYLSDEEDSAALGYLHEGGNHTGIAGPRVIQEKTS